MAGYQEYREWRDIVYYPQYGGHHCSREARLNVDAAVRREDLSPDEPMPEKIGLRLTLSDVILRPDDAFECMQIGDYGSVGIWTRHFVWVLNGQGGTEQWIFLPRNPDSPSRSERLRSAVQYSEWQEFVRYLWEPERVRSREDRLHTKDALRIADIVDRETIPGLARKYGFIELESDFSLREADDPFECMEIDDWGNVIVWTRRRVWTLYRRSTMEQRLYLQRNPSVE